VFVDFAFAVVWILMEEGNAFEGFGVGWWGEW